MKEKELELFTLKTQKLENLCRALQEERKSLYQKLQESQSPGTAEDTATKVEVEEIKDLNQEAKSHEEVLNEPNTTATALTKEIQNLKLEKSRLEEVAATFTISHFNEKTVPPAEASEVSEHSESLQVSQETAESTTDREIHLDEEITPSTETLSDKNQEIRDQEMNNVD